MGYDNITTNITLAEGYGTTLLDPLIIGSYNLAWRNAPGYLNPTGDPSVGAVTVSNANGNKQVYNTMRD